MLGEYASPPRTEASPVISGIARDGKPGLADYVGCVAASTALGMTKSGQGGHACTDRRRGEPGGWSDLAELMVT